MDSQRADKKQKLDVSNDDFCVHQLPDAALTRAAAFLNFNDRVLFAMALPTWRESQTHDISKAIVGAELVDHRVHKSRRKYSSQIIDRF
jgi:hypothetical protein